MSSAKDSPWYSTPASARKRKPLGITLSPAALKRIKQLAETKQLSRSQIIEELIMSARLHSGGDEEWRALGSAMKDKVG